MMVTTSVSNAGDNVTPVWGGVKRPPEGAVGADDEQALANTNTIGHKRHCRVISTSPFRNLEIGPAEMGFNCSGCKCRRACRCAGGLGQQPSQPYARCQPGPSRTA